tara:strand:- start:6 stop:287 length:282 start_codon:yes stop_codon:yes gene_type:complete
MDTESMEVIIKACGSLADLYRLERIVGVRVHQLMEAKKEVGRCTNNMKTIMVDSYKQNIADKKAAQRKEVQQKVLNEVAGKLDLKDRAETLLV